MWNNFFKHVDIDPQNAHILDGNAADLEQECAEYEKKITEAGGIQLFIGGGCWFNSFCTSSKPRSL
jgi:glucosamine-6-phosphate deaminase